MSKGLRNVFKQLAATNMDLSHCFLDINCPHRHWARKNTAFPSVSPAGLNAHTMLSRAEIRTKYPGQAATDGGPRPHGLKSQSRLHRREDSATPTPGAQLRESSLPKSGPHLPDLLGLRSLRVTRRGICQSPIGNCQQPDSKPQIDLRALIRHRLAWLQKV